MNLKKFGLAGLILILALSLMPASNPVYAQTGNCGEVYVVQRGDTLREIADRCGLTVDAIVNLNPFIDDRNLIYPGWILELQPPTDGVGIPQTGAPPRSNALYVVKPGDTLPYIARRLDISENDLLSVNPSLEGAEDLRTGQILRLSNTLNTPAAAVSPAVAEPGQAVTVLAGGFPANTTVVFSGGPLGTQGFELARATTGDSGWVRSSVQIPVNVERGNRWAIVAHQANNTSVRAATNLLYVVDTSGPAEPIVYTVRINDTLSSIAVRFGVSIESILAINPQIENARVITVGQEILVPGELMRQQPVEGEAGIFLGANRGAAGSEVEIFGTGFEADSAITLRVTRTTNNRIETLSTSQVQASPRGTFYTNLDIPTTARLNETLQITAQPEDDDGGVIPASAAFVVTQSDIPQTGNPGDQPDLTLSPSSGPAGTIFSVTVSGYPSNTPIEMGIGASQAGSNVTYDYTTDADGNFIANIQVPQNSPIGSYYTINIIPENSSQPSLTARFTVNQ